MIYFNLENGYESFKENFGMRKTNDGQKVRKDKVTLNILKDLFRNKKGNEEMWDALFFAHTMRQPMSQQDLIVAGRSIVGGAYSNNIMDGKYQLTSDVYCIDNGGLCYDGDEKSIRYVKDGHVYKMKASRLYGKIFCEHGLDKKLGTRMQIFCGEKFADDWCAYAEQKIGKGLYTLHTGSDMDDFEKIYDNDSSFGSCMSRDDQHSFYHDAVNATAAWLEDNEGELVCRCIIFDECIQYGTEKKFRIAERQYAKDGDDKLKNILVARLYAEGLIDAHKRVGASCNRDGWRQICDKDGNELDETRFSIRCVLDPGDTLSYQDTFKEYDEGNYRAYNYGDFGAQLDETDSTYNGREEYDDWEGEYYRNEEMYHAYWRNSYGDICSGYVAQTNIDKYFVCCERGYYRDEYVCQDDAVCIDGEYWCICDNDIVEIDDEWYEKGAGCEYCNDIEDYSINYIEYGYAYYANYTWSELLKKDIPDEMFDDVEQEYAERNGFVKDDDGDWVLASELEDENEEESTNNVVAA